MFRPKKLHEIVTYLLLFVLSLSSHSLASVKTVQKDGSLVEISMNSTRRLLSSWNDNETILKSSSYNNNDTTVVGVIVFTIVCVIILLIRCCIKYVCTPEEEDSYSDAVVHPPSRRFADSRPVAQPPAAGFTTFAAPRTNSTLIFPPDGEPFSINVIGIDNPSYNYTTDYQRPIPTAPVTSLYGSTNENLTDLSDLPPAYDTVVREDVKGYSGKKPPTFPKVG